MVGGGGGGVAGQKIYVFEKKNVLRKLSAPCPGAIYMYITIIFKHLFL